MALVPPASQHDVCPLCRKRRAKRMCPAKGESICSLCCGSKRRTQIACPEDCVYLTGAHAPSWEGRQTEQRRDLRRIASCMESLSREQTQLFFFAIARLASLRSSHPGLDDHLLEEALTAWRKTVETRERGVLYEHHPSDARAERLSAELRGLFDTLKEIGHPPPDRDVLPVLRAIEKVLAGVQRERGGPTTFLETAERLTDHLELRQAPEPRTQLPSLIVEP